MCVCVYIFIYTAAEVANDVKTIVLRSRGGKSARARGQMGFVYCLFVSLDKLPSVKVNRTKFSVS